MYMLYSDHMVCDVMQSVIKFQLICGLLELCQRQSVLISLFLQVLKLLFVIFWNVWQFSTCHYLSMSFVSVTFSILQSIHFSVIVICYVLQIGESVSVVKFTEPVNDPRAVNQDKKNILFSVSIVTLCTNACEVHVYKHRLLYFVEELF